MYNNKKITAIVNCAGNGVRFGKNKLVQTIGVHDDFTSDPVILKTVRSFVQPEIDEIIVTVHEKYFDLYEKILITENNLPVKLIIGGKVERYESTLKGLEVATGDYVLTHDGVRPFVSRAMILNLLQTIGEYKAAILATKATTTIKKIDAEKMEIVESLRREESWLAQTPQLFEKKLLQECYDEAVRENYQIVSDDSELISRFSKEKIRIVTGDEKNIKITFPMDLELAQIINAELNHD